MLKTAWSDDLVDDSRKEVSSDCLCRVCQLCQGLFTAVLQTAEKGKAVASSDAFYAADTSDPVTDWQDYSNFYDEYDDDEEVRSFQWEAMSATAPGCFQDCL